MRKEEADRLKQRIDTAYHRRDDYPPYALTPWEDRVRYKEFIFKVIDETVEEKEYSGVFGI